MSRKVIYIVSCEVINGQTRFCVQFFTNSKLSFVSTQSFISQKYIVNGDSSYSSRLSLVQYALQQSSIVIVEKKNLLFPQCTSLMESSEYLSQKCALRDIK